MIGVYVVTGLLIWVVVCVVLILRAVDIRNPKPWRVTDREMQEIEDYANRRWNRE